MITVIEHWCLRMQTFLEDSLPLAACLSKSAPSVFSFGFPCFNAKCFRSRSEEQQELVAELKNNERYFGKVCSLCLHGSFRKMLEAHSLGTYSQCWETGFGEEIEIFFVNVCFAHFPTPALSLFNTCYDTPYTFRASQITT